MLCTSATDGRLADDVDVSCPAKYNADRIPGVTVPAFGARRMSKCVLFLLFFVICFGYLRSRTTPDRDEDASYEQHWFGLHCCYLLTSTRFVSLLCLKKHTNTVRRVIFVLHLGSRMIHPCSSRGRPSQIPQASQYVCLCRLCLSRPPSLNEFS